MRRFTLLSLVLALADGLLPLPRGLIVRPQALGRQSHRLRALSDWEKEMLDRLDEQLPRLDPTATGKAAVDQLQASSAALDHLGPDAERLLQHQLQALREVNMDFLSMTNLPQVGGLPQWMYEVQPGPGAASQISRGLSSEYAKLQIEMLREYYVFQDAFVRELQQIAADVKDYDWEGWEAQQGSWFPGFQQISENCDSATHTVMLTLSKVIDFNDPNSVAAGATVFSLIIAAVRPVLDRGQATDESAPVDSPSSNAAIAPKIRPGTAAVARSSPTVASIRANTAAASTAPPVTAAMATPATPVQAVAAPKPASANPPTPEPGPTPAAPLRAVAAPETSSEDPLVSGDGASSVEAPPLEVDGAAPVAAVDTADRTLLQAAERQAVLASLNVDDFADPELELVKLLAASEEETARVREMLKDVLTQLATQQEQQAQTERSKRLLETTLTDQIEAMSAEMDDLRSQLADKNYAADQNSELQNLRLTVDAKDSEIAKLVATVSDLVQKLEQSEERKALEMQQLVAAKDSEVAALTDKMSQLIAKLDAPRDDVAAVQAAKVSQLQAEAASKDADVAALSEMVTQLVTKLDASVDEAAAAKAEVAYKNRELESLSSVVASLSDKVDKSMAALAERKEAELAEIKDSQLSVISAQLSGLTAAQESAQSRNLAMLSDRVGALVERLDGNVLQPPPEPPAQSAQLDAVAEQVRSLTSRFEQSLSVQNSNLRNQVAALASEKAAAEARADLAERQANQAKLEVNAARRDASMGSADDATSSMWASSDLGLQDFGEVNLDGAGTGLEGLDMDFISRVASELGEDIDRQDQAIAAAAALGGASTLELQQGARVVPTDTLDLPFDEQVTLDFEQEDSDLRQAGQAGVRAMKVGELRAFLLNRGLPDADENGVKYKKKQLVDIGLDYLGL